MDGKKIIVYLTKYDNQDFWAYISNFLCKFSRKEAMAIDETHKVSTFVINDTVEKKKLVQAVWERKDNSRMISKPEKLYDIGLAYKNLFCIYIEADELSDVVELQNLYLIYRYFKNEQILVVINGKADNYFKVSHFFRWVNIQNEDFYNAVYYHNVQKGDIKRLEKTRSAAFERFLPLLEIDEKTEKLLRSTFGNLVDDKRIESALEGEKIKVGTMDLENSVLRQLSNKRNAFRNCDKKKLICEIKKMDLLTIILLADSLTYYKKIYGDIKEVEQNIGVLKRHVQGYLQLTENILFHTKEKVGVFCLRLLNEESRYIKEKYSISEMQKQHLYFEIMISDYSGNCSNGNLAQTFIDNLEDSSLKKEFEGLKPVHFFQEYNEMDEKIQKAWENYYADVEHIGKHYGLKIFKALVLQTGGNFVVESHSEHQIGDGECYGREVGQKLCMPGTSYSVLMPINFENKYISQMKTVDFGIANAIDYEMDVNKICNIKVSYNNGKKLGKQYSNQRQKYELVDEMTDIFKLHNKEAQIAAIDAIEIPTENAELIYKALVKLSDDESQLNYIVFYNCTTEFIRRMWEIAYSLFKTMPSQFISKKHELQIVLYTKNDYEEMIIIPNNYSATFRLNDQINFTKETKWRDLFQDKNQQEQIIWDSPSKLKNKILPYDVIIHLNSQEQNMSIFEHYTRHIVDRNIQQQFLGCKFESTHMRLGSTIHVDRFYEAEFLFGINLFVDRFALLIALDLKEKLENVNKVTLYGYAAYSELLIYKLKNYIENTYKSIDVDYVILERQSQERGTKNSDKIRYSKYFMSEQERKQYYSDRKLVCIVPIGSTLKTNEKLINMFLEQNGEACRNNILEDYEIILVGNLKNQYWKIVENKRINSLRSSSLQLNPRFFIRFDMKYEESLQCSMCFPEKVLDEIPLIEVNAASTIPNQEFGIQKMESGPVVCTPEQIKELEQQMQVLKDCFLYSHTQNGEAHFLFYVQTNLLMIQKRKEIILWLKKKKEEMILEKEAYNIIFCPTHARNVGFAECINEVIFDSSAIIIQDDIDKEYRSNFFAKYSNIYLFIKKIMEEGKEDKIQFYYADDAIITGRSFQRAKSLLKSIVKEFFHDSRKEYCIFESLFVLVDRNSEDNKKMYVGNEWTKHFFSFSSLHVSSLRTHGDACVLCNLENDAERLKQSSVGLDMYTYWDEQKKKFAPDEVENFTEKDEYKDKSKNNRAFRRLVCANEIGVFLNEMHHGNDKKNAMICILHLIINGCNRLCDTSEYSSVDEMQREYFLSYCKILSRPFVVFNKSVKEAVFDFLLVFTESLLTTEKVSEVIKNTEHKLYLADETVITLLRQCEILVHEAFIKEHREMELLHVLLKQLTEMKSNYVIRGENINKIVKYVEGFPEEKIIFYERYMSQVKKLLGVSSDTSKSAWFDYLLSQKKEYGKEKNVDFLLPQSVYEQLYIENNRVISDAILKLSQKVEFTEQEKSIFIKKNFLSKEVVIKEKYDVMDMTKQIHCEPIYKSEEELLLSVGGKIERALQSYLLKDYREILKSYSDNDIEKRESMIPIATQILLYQYINRNFGDNQLKREGEDFEKTKISLTEQGKNIAIYLNYILRAQKTYILLESISEADAWEDTIIEKYNELVCKVGQENLKLNLKKTKEYLQLGSSWDENRNMIFSNRKLAERLKEVCSSEKFKKKGYYFLLENNENIFIWKLGMEEKQVYICSELECGRKRKEYLNDIRNVLQFSYLLNHRVFNVNNTAFFLEIVAAAKNLSYSLGKKVVTHTPYMIRMQQYTQLYEKNSEEQRKTDIIMLLADLNISTHYRQSLQKDYYIRMLEFERVPWGESNPVFNGSFPCEFYVPIGEFETRTRVIVNNEGFSYNDGKGERHEEEAVDEKAEMICYKIANASREVILMLYLMIANSAVEGRSETEDRSVNVYLSKTVNGELRISNKLNKKNDKKIKTDFLEIPPYDDEGISIWTVSRYLKSFAAIILNKKLAGIAEKLADVTVEELQKMRNEIEELPQKVKVRIEYIFKEHEEYFSIVLPIFAEKYKDIF